MSEYQAKVEEISLVPIKTELVADAAANTTTLQVATVAPFSDTGGSLAINGTAYVYSTVDESLATVTLLQPLAAAAAAETDVFQDPYAEKKMALCRMDTAEDSVWARVPHALQATFQDGVRQFTFQETVLLDIDLDGEFVIKEKVAQAVYIDGNDVIGFPDLTDRVDELEQGGGGPQTPPGGSPTLQATGTNTAIVLTALGVVDPETILDYYMNGVLVKTTRGTVVVIQEGATGGPLQAGEEYAFNVVARNTAGNAAPSPTISASLNPNISSEDIKAIVRAGFVLAGRIEVGNIIIDPDVGIQIPIPSTNSAQPKYITFPADGTDAVIDAILRTGDLSVNGGLSINDISNFLNGTMTLSAGLPNPNSRASLGTYTSARATKLDNLNENNTYLRGMCFRSNNSGRIAVVQRYESGTQRSRIKIFDELNGGNVVTIAPQGRLTGGSNEGIYFADVTDVDGIIYALTYKWNGNVSEYQYMIQKFTWAGAFDGQYFLTDVNDNRIAKKSESSDGGIGWHAGSNSLWIARLEPANKNLRFYRFSSVGTRATNQIVSSGSDITYINCMDVTQADLAGVRFVVSGDQTASGAYGVVPYDRDSGQAVPSEAWYRNAGRPSGVAWHPAAGVFYSTEYFSDGKLNELHTFNSQTTSQTIALRYTWYDTNPTAAAGTSPGNKESKGSPQNTIVVFSREFLYANVPAPPKTGSGVDDSDAVRLYCNVLGSPLRLSQTITTGVSGDYYVTNMKPGTTQPVVPEVSTFSTTTNLGKLKTNSENWWVDGSGAGKAGPWEWDKTGKLLANSLSIASQGIIPDPDNAKAGSQLPTYETMFNIVMLGGILDSVASGGFPGNTATAIGYIPPYDAPAQNLRFVVAVGSGYGHLIVTSTGEISIRPIGTAAQRPAYLAGATWPADH